MRWRRGRGAALQEETLGAGAVLRGRLWCGDGTAYDDGRVVIAADGTVTAMGPSSSVDVPYGALEIDGTWVGPGLTDAHVHLAFGTVEELLQHGVVSVRDLGAPPPDAVRWRQLSAPRVQVAGPLLTAAGGYPSRSWGSKGFAAFVDDVDQADRLVTGLATQVDVIKLALEPAGGPVPTPDVCAAVVRAAHDGGRPVTCHALTVAMVERALDAGVDELAHTPVERLPDELISRIAADGVRVVSTLHTFESGDDGVSAVANAAALHAAGVAIVYGTDLGNTGITPGADPRELTLLAEEVGLGAEATLRSATTPIRVGEPAGLVVLADDPGTRPKTWREPRAVLVGTTLLLHA